MPTSQSIPSSFTSGMLRQRISRALAMTLMILAIPTAILYLAPSLVILGYFLFILPGIILQLIPNVFVYVAVFSIAWFCCSRFHVALGLAAGFAAVAALAFLVPEALNRRTASWIADAEGLNVDTGFRVRAADLRTVALVADRHSENAICDDLCQLLLYNRQVQRVIVLPASRPLKARQRHPHDPTAFRIERAASCQGQPTVKGRADWANWLKNGQSAAIAAAVQQRIAAGECLIPEPSGVDADLTIRRVQVADGDVTRTLRFSSPGVDRRGIEILQRDKVVIRKLVIQSGLLQKPLRMTVSDSGVQATPWHWARQAIHEGEAVDLERLLKERTDFVLTVPDGISTSELRERIDAALNNPASPATDAAFSLLPQFIESLPARGRHGDNLRLARVLKDERFINFELIHKRLWEDPAYSRDLADAAVDRMLTLREDRQLAHLYTRLDKALPLVVDGAFAKPDSRVDQLLADPATRDRSPRLIARLADRGPSQAPRFVQIIKDRQASRLRSGERPWNNEAFGAMWGLCRLGDAARSQVTELRAMEASGEIPPHIVQLDSWQSMLVALGVSPSEFEPRGGARNADARRVQQYRDKLARLAQNGCGISR